MGYLIHTQTNLTTTAQVAELATRYSHEIGRVILVLAVFVVGFIFWKGVKK